MRVISIFQPWCQLIADRRVRLTVKGWPIEPGLLAIHAANRINAEKAIEFKYNPETLVQGAVIAFVEVTECLALPHPRVRHSIFFGTFTDDNGVEHPSVQEGRYAFKLNVLMKLRKPYGPMKGKFKVWEIPDSELWEYITTLRTIAPHAFKADGGSDGASGVGNSCGSTASEPSRLAISK